MKIKKQCKNCSHWVEKCEIGLCLKYPYKWTDYNHSCINYKQVNRGNM